MLVFVVNRTSEASLGCIWRRRLNSTACLYFVCSQHISLNLLSNFLKLRTPLTGTVPYTLLALSCVARYDHTSYFAVCNFTIQLLFHLSHWLYCFYILYSCILTTIMKHLIWLICNWGSQPIHNCHPQDSEIENLAPGLEVPQGQNNIRYAVIGKKEGARMIP